jgi:protein involved in polysaccharide export with SLBB domain
MSKLFLFSVFVFCLFIPSKLLAQAAMPLTEEFLAGLPPSVADELRLNNAVQKEEELEKLFRADIRFTKSKDILEKVRYELKAIEKRLDEVEGAPKKGGLERFGDSFFSTIQASFMPVNVPSASGKYVVGVGDKFQLMLTGTTKVSSASSEEQMVQRDGTITIPNIGKLRIAGLTLDEAEEAVAQYLEKTSPGVLSFLSLTKIRDIDVILLGGVVSPGIFTLGGGSNILTALNVAGGISENGSYRKIEHKRNGETLQLIDLYQIFIFGDINFDQDMQSGDVLFVHPIQNSVPVSGGVNTQAIFEALPGETAEDLVKYAGNFSASFNGYDSVYIKRNDLSSQQIIDLPLKDLKSFVLKPRDIVLVPSYKNILEPAKEVVLEGMVERPGTYYVGETETLGDLIQRAGGYKENAYEFGGALFRETALDTEQHFSKLTYSDTINFIIARLSQPGINITADFGKLLAEELRSRISTGRVVAEFNINKLKKDPSKDTILKHKDRIVIPPLEKVVYLFGDFKKPTNLSFNPNANIKDYISMAGGLNDSAQKEIVIIDPSGVSNVYTKAFFANGKVELYPGSVIYAPRDIGKIDGIRYAATISPIVSSLAISLASLNSIKD